MTKQQNPLLSVFERAAALPQDPSMSLLDRLMEVFPPFTETVLSTLEDSSRDFEAEAEYFWIHLLERNKIWTGAGDTVSFSPPTHYFHIPYKEFITKGVLFPALFCHYPSRYSESFAIVRGTLNWPKIRACFSGLKVKEEDLEFIVFILKPWPFTNQFTKGYPELNSFVESTCADINKVIKRVSPLVNQFKNIELPYPDILPTIGLDYVKFKYYLAVCRKIVQLGKKIPDMYFKHFGIEATKYRSPQKHTFWKYAVAGAVNRLNKYCHDDNCDKRCNVFHLQAFRVVACLLKILYPSIWRENHHMITKRIKTKCYTSILS
jgi:hypothetical protein